MNSLTIIGTGRLGKLLEWECQVVQECISARMFLEMPDMFHRTSVVYAGGPAGDQACLRDPELAVTLHVTVVRRLLEMLTKGRFKNLTLLGTVAPLVGIYGPLKQIGMDWAWNTAIKSRLPVTILELGQVIGPEIPIDGDNAGAIAHMLRSIRDDLPIKIYGSGNQLIYLTPSKSLIDYVNESRDSSKLQMLAVVSIPFRVIDIAEIIRSIARRPDHPIEFIPVPKQPESYRKPQGERRDDILPLAASLASWIEALGLYPQVQGIEKT